MCVDEPRSSVARVRARAHESSAPSGHSAQSTSAAMASSIAAGLLEKQFTFYRCSVSIVAIPSAGEFVTILFLSEKIFFWKKRNTVSIPRFNNNNSASICECVCVCVCDNIRYHNSQIYWISANIHTEAEFDDVFISRFPLTRSNKWSRTSATRGDTKQTVRKRIKLLLLQGERRRRRRNCRRRSRGPLRCGVSAGDRCLFFGNTQAGRKERVMTSVDRKCRRRRAPKIAEHVRASVSQ